MAVESNDGTWLSAFQYAIHPGLGYLLLLAVLMAGILLRASRENRAVLFGTTALLLGALFALATSGLLHALGIADTAATLHEVAVLVEGIALIRLTGLFLFRSLLPSVHVAPPRILEDMAVIAGYLVWALVRLRYAGLDLSSIVTTSAVLTAVIAFSMQDTLGNILGGIALQLDDSLQVGDWIKVDDITGKVVDVRWRSTSIETRNWETAVIPNSQLMKGKFLVLGRRRGHPEQWRRWVWFSVGYQVPPQQVIDAVERALAKAVIPRVAPEPAPNCVLMDFADSAARFAVRYWLTDLAADDPTDSAVRTHIYAALRRAGINLSIPEQYLHLEQESEQQEGVRHRREIETRLGFLRQIELFAPLIEDELRLVAERLKYTPFASGDVMTQQGAVAHWLYVVTRGRAEALLEAPDGGRRSLAVIDADQGVGFFGEMGLMTGEPRTATVIARSDVECYRLDKESFAGIIQTRPAIAEAMSKVMARRLGGLESARQALDAGRARARAAHQESDVLRRIRRFFGLSGSRQPESAGE